MSLMSLKSQVLAAQQCHLLNCMFYKPSMLTLSTALFVSSWAIFHAQAASIRRQEHSAHSQNLLWQGVIPCWGSACVALKPCGLAMAPHDCIEPHTGLLRIIAQAPQYLKWHQDHTCSAWHLHIFDLIS